jgi:hypothetical protein
MPRKRPAQPRQALPTPLPADRGRCPSCWTLRPVDDAGKISLHQVRARYHGDQVPLITCSGTGQEPAGQVVHSASHVRRL